MSKEYLPVLIINALEQTNTYYTTEQVVRAIRQTVENQSSTRHAHHVKVEMDRRQKIIDDAEAERARQEAARKRRRERRRKLRIYVDKLALLGKIFTISYHLLIYQKKFKLLLYLKLWKLKVRLLQTLPMFSHQAKNPVYSKL